MLTSLEVGSGNQSSCTCTDSVIEDISWPAPAIDIQLWEKDFPSLDESSLAPVDVQKDSDLIHIVHVTVEMEPVAKVGGLGVVVTGLARACLSRGHKVAIMLPFYECIPKQQINDLQLTDTFNTYHGGKWVPTNSYHGVVSGIPVVFVEPNNHFFKGQSVYGSSYNEIRGLFIFHPCLP